MTQKTRSKIQNRVPGTGESKIDSAIVIRGAREHNLKNIDLDIPKNRLVVITGLSGSGKSTLAFDTIFAEGQRRYVESLSAYARQFLGQLNKPDVDHIEGLSPAIAIDQKSTTRNPRSTVGTVTEIYDYLRLLFARVGTPHCPICGRVVQQQTPQQIVDALLHLPDGSRLLLLAPLVEDKRGEHQKVLDDARKAGFVRARIDGTVYDLDEDLPLDKHRQHNIEVVVDRLVIRHETRDTRHEVGDRSPDTRHPAPDTRDHPDRVRVTDSVETALKQGGGVVIAQIVGGEELRFSEHYACPVHGALPYGAFEPRDFSFNNPRAACPTCGGLGTVLEIDPDLVIPDRDLSISQGAIAPWWRTGRNARRYFEELLGSVAQFYGFGFDTPVRNLSPEVIDVILHGSGERTLPLRYHVRGRVHTVETPFEGVMPYLRRRVLEATDEDSTDLFTQYMSPRLCQTCHGARLRPEPLAVTIGDRNIAAVTALSIGEALGWFGGLVEGGEQRAENKEQRNQEPRTKNQEPGNEEQGSKGAGEPEIKNQEPEVGNGEPETRNSELETSDLQSQIQNPKSKIIAEPIVREVRARLRFLLDVGLDYLTLHRTAATLSGGEAQRIRLATQIGSGLSGVLYVLDEPSIGLHPRDHGRLLRTIVGLRDLGNSVLVVEHDVNTIRAADWLIDVGPGAGEHGGEIVATGTVREVMRSPRSLTGAFLSGKRQISIPRLRRSGSGEQLVVHDAHEHNLKHISVAFPLGTLICVTGVSGSGKSTLVEDILSRKLHQHFYNSRTQPGAHGRIDGLDHVDKVIGIDQSPIGRSPRSNPATYTKMFDAIRELFAQTPEARARGYTAGRFSFNVKGGRCENCKGEGMIEVEMQFLPDLFVPCEVCNGARYNRETLDIRYRGQNIADVLNMTVEEARSFFDRIPAINNKLQTLIDVGLSYLRLGQPANTLSGGEAQRIKLATELAKRSTGRTIYILDEPTTGLHFADVEQLLLVLQRLVDAGNTIVVIEHNLDVIKCADWVIDIGPEGGEAGGSIVATGTPEAIAANDRSYTGAYLREVLG
jgi:excinuclease ABC subunit A